jgi:hypothetical protein
MKISDFGFELSTVSKLYSLKVVYMFNLFLYSMIKKGGCYGSFIKIKLKMSAILQ